MGAELQVDDTLWREAVIRAQEATGQGLADVLNSMAADVALRAMQFTPKASAQEIRNLPNNSPMVVTTDQRTGRKHVAPLWVLYVQKRLREKGVTVKYQVRLKKKDWQPKFVNGVWTEGRTKSEFRKIGGSGHTNWSADEQVKASKRIIDARLRSIGFLRAGFIPAARAFADAAGKVVRVSSLRMMLHSERGSSGVAKGGFKLAIAGESPMAEISNSAVSKGKHSSKPGSGDGALVRYAGAALEKAVNFVAQDKLDWAEKHIEKELKRFFS
jgi:hypothetical protein